MRDGIVDLFFFLYKKRMDEKPGGRSKQSFLATQTKNCKNPTLKRATSYEYGYEQINLEKKYTMLR